MRILVHRLSSTYVDLPDEEFKQLIKDYKGKDTSIKAYRAFKKLDKVFERHLTGKEPNSGGVSTFSFSK